MRVSAHVGEHIVQSTYDVVGICCLDRGSGCGRLLLLVIHRHLLLDTLRHGLLHVEAHRVHGVLLELGKHLLLSHLLLGHHVDIRLLHHHLLGLHLRLRLGLGT